MSHLRLLSLFIFVLFAARSVDAAEGGSVLLASGERSGGPVFADGPRWRVAGKDTSARDVLVVRFSSEAPPPRLESAVFLRDGTLLSGSLSTLVGENAEIASGAFGALKLKRDLVAAVISPPLPGKSDEHPELSDYVHLLAATLRTPGASFVPGSACRLLFHGGDEMPAERIMRVGTEQVLASGKGKGVESVNRQVLRLIELPAPPLPVEADAGNPEMAVRLKSGDILRGRVLKLDDKVLTLRSATLSDREIPRALLATIFQVGDSGERRWLSTRTPSAQRHTPVFDHQSIARVDASVAGTLINVGGEPCERGVGVQSRSELTYDLEAGKHRFVALCGLDASAQGRGDVVARVLADGKEVWSSGALTARDGARPVNVDLGAARQLQLVVEYGSTPDDSGDHFSWGWAMVVKY